jgi:hypothetical protein
MKVFSKNILINNLNNDFKILLSKGLTKSLKNPSLKMNYHTKTIKIQSTASSQIHNKSSFHFIQKRTFFEKLKEKLLKSTQHKLKQIKKEEEFYVPQDEIVFIDKKYLLVDASKNFTDAIKFMQNFILYPLMTVWSYFFLRAIYRINFVSFLLSGFFTATFFRMNFGINQNKKHIIIKMFLLENGKECEIHTLEKSFVTDIKNIRRLQVEEGLYVARNIQNMRKNYIPLAIDTKLYLIPLVSVIQNQEVLSAVSNGKYIKTDDGINVENSIDIDPYDKNKH